MPDLIIVSYAVFGLCPWEACPWEVGGWVWGKGEGVGDREWGGERGNYSWAEIYQGRINKREKKKRQKVEVDFLIKQKVK